jgi:hypothetical protein
LIDKGAKFKGGNRGQGKKAQEWRDELFFLSEGLEGDKLNFNVILKRIEDAIIDEDAITYSSSFWYKVNRQEELIFFDDGLESISFKTVKNEIANLRKKISHKTK